MRTDIHKSISNFNTNNDRNKPFIQITPEQIHRYLNSPKLNKGTGPDGIRNQLLKYGYKHLATTISTIFNNIFKTGHYPKTGKFLKPIHKKGDKNKPVNYKGISLQNCIIKLLSTILNDGLYDYVEVNNQFY